MAAQEKQKTETDIKKASPRLLNDAYWPATSSFGFLECDSETVAYVCTDWLFDLNTYKKYKFFYARKRRVKFVLKKRHGPLPNLLRQLAPLTDLELRRYLFVPTRSPWTAYFDNGWRGAEPARISYLSERMSCRGIRIVCEPRNIVRDGGPEYGTFGAVILDLKSPDGEGTFGTERSIYAANDGYRWEFEARGGPLPFEDLEAYKKRRIPDRFTPEMLQRYLRELGIDAFNEDFYVATKKRPAYLIDIRGERWSGMKNRSFYEAQLGYTRPPEEVRRSFLHKIFRA